MTTDEPVSGYPRKRRQTRRRLVRAGIETFAADGLAGMTAGSIARAAEVAVGTFYNHFPTVDDLLDAIAARVGRGIEIGSDALIEVEHDPAARVAIGVLQLIEMADTDPAAAATFVGLAAVRPSFRSSVRTIVSDTIADGVGAGRFDVEADGAATNAVLGTVLQSMRSRVLGEVDRSEGRAVARLTLRLLGVAPAEADAIIDRAAAASVAA